MGQGRPCFRSALAHSMCCMLCRSPRLPRSLDSRHPRAPVTGTLPPLSELSQSATPARRTMDGALEGRHGNLLAARRALEQRHRLEV